LKDEQVEFEKISQKGGKEVVIISDIDEKGRSRSHTINKQFETLKSNISESDENVNRTSSGNKKREKLAKPQTHDPETGERVRYFNDDDIKLNELIQREKRAGEDYDSHFADNVLKSSKFRFGISKMDNMNSDFDEDDDYHKWESKQSKQSIRKQENKEKQKAISDTKRYDKEQIDCYYCFENKKVPTHLVMAIGDFVYLMLPERPMNDNNCYIVPMLHLQGITMMEENVWNEVKLFMLSLEKMFRSFNKEVVFCETVMQLKKKRHTIIECFSMSRDEFAQAPMYFKKAIQESESEWSQHKKLIDTSEKGLRRSIPPHFPYFFVSFGTTKGYGHVIEESKKFSRFFGREVISGILQLSPDSYLRPKRQSIDDEKKRCKRFLDLWKNFDWTVQLFFMSEINSL